MTPPEVMTATDSQESSDRPRSSSAAAPIRTKSSHPWTPAPGFGARGYQALEAPGGRQGYQAGG